MWKSTSQRHWILRCPQQHQQPFSGISYESFQSAVFTNKHHISGRRALSQSHETSLASEGANSSSSSSSLSSDSLPEPSSTSSLPSTSPPKEKTKTRRPKRRLVEIIPLEMTTKDRIRFLMETNQKYDEQRHQQLLVREQRGKRHGKQPLESTSPEELDKILAMLPSSKQVGRVLEKAADRIKWARTKVFQNWNPDYGKKNPLIKPYKPIKMDEWWWFCQIAFALAPSIVIILYCELYGKYDMEMGHRRQEIRHIEELLGPEAAKQFEQDMIAYAALKPSPGVLDRVSDALQQLAVFLWGKPDEKEESKIATTEHVQDVDKNIDHEEKRMDDDADHGKEQSSILTTTQELSSTTVPAATTEKSEAISASTIQQHNNMEKTPPQPPPAPAAAAAAAITTSASKSTDVTAANVTEHANQRSRDAAMDELLQRVQRLETLLLERTTETSTLPPSKREDEEKLRKEEFEDIKKLSRRSDVQTRVERDLIKSWKEKRTALAQMENAPAPKNESMFSWVTKGLQTFSERTSDGYDQTKEWMLNKMEPLYSNAVKLNNPDDEGTHEKGKPADDTMKEETEQNTEPADKDCIPLTPTNNEKVTDKVSDAESESNSTNQASEASIVTRRWWKVW